MAEQHSLYSYLGAQGTTASKSLGSLVSGMPSRARAIRHAAGAAIAAASNAEGSSVRGAFKEIWTTLATDGKQDISPKPSVLLQPGWAVKRFTHASADGESPSL